MEDPPLLSYANDAAPQARLDLIRRLKWCVLISAIVYYVIYILAFILPGAWALAAIFVSYGVQVVMMVFVIWLGKRVQGLLTGVVMALLVGVPCAGPCIPFYLVAQANEAMRDEARKALQEKGTVIR